jgi:hypothetical protein
MDQIIRSPPQGLRPRKCWLSFRGIHKALHPSCAGIAKRIIAIAKRRFDISSSAPADLLFIAGFSRSHDLANSAVCHLYRLPLGINYALKLLPAPGTSERQSLVRISSSAQKPRVPE